MSTRYDIRDAKLVYGMHIQQHGCREGTCAERASLFEAWMSTADRWMTEPGDDHRQWQQSQDILPSPQRQFTQAA